MDENKRIKLTNINYSIKKTCGNCKYSSLIDNWGTCSFHQYTHLKHEKGNKTSIRQLSINRYGCCFNHVYSTNYLINIKHFENFIVKQNAGELSD